MVKQHELLSKPRNKHTQTRSHINKNTFFSYTVLCKIKKPPGAKSWEPVAQWSGGA